jgi:flagellar hook-basal body protein
MSLEALYTGVSGLQATSTWMDIIGNNIANSNTVGFKSSRAMFSEQLTQFLQYGTSPNNQSGNGGTDSEVIGLGTKLQDIQTLFVQGPTLETGISTDISIQGNGFLIAKQGNQTYLTRDGQLSFDANGNLVNASGELIQGYTAVPQFLKTGLNTYSNIPGQPALITDASLTLNTTGTIGNIQIPQDLTMPPKATSEINFSGNLDALQQANQPGGIVDLFPGFPAPNASPSLPLGLDLAYFGPVGLNPQKAQPIILPGGGIAIQQVGNLAGPAAPGSSTVEPVVLGAVNLGFVKAFNNFAWDQNPPIPPADETSTTVYDSLGNPHQITFLFYQVNDLGSAGVNNPNGPNQVAYAWYAFDTTGGQKPTTANLLGGTGIWEGNLSNPGGLTFYDRNQNNFYFGDLLYFNTDGSLASTGGTEGIGGPGGLAYPSIPEIYLPPFNSNPPVSPIPTDGAEIMGIQINFGTPGVLTQGQRNGLISDAEGSYQVKNGQQVYIPQQTAYVSSQNGYPDGQLESLSFNQTGVIQGAFSNGQNVSLGQVALANVENTGGLNANGNNQFTTSTNSGATFEGLAGQNGLGLVQGGTLEGSNVNLATELSNMIIAQEAFNSNARTVTTVNQVLKVLDQLGQ